MERRIITLLLVLSVIQGVLFATIVPPWQAPDEPKHFEYVALLHDKGRLISEADANLDLQKRIISSMLQHDFWRFGYANSPPEASSSFASIWHYAPSLLFRPPLYYVVQAIVYNAVAQQETTIQLYTLRLVSVLMGALVVFIAFLTTKTLFPKDALLVVAVPAFIVFLPMHSFIFSTVNSDNLANLIAALFIFGLVRGFKQGFSPLGLAGLLVLVSLGLLTKRTVAFTIPLGIAALTIYLLRQDVNPSVRRRIAISAFAFVSLVALSLPFWNWMGVGRDILDKYVFNGTALTILQGFLSRGYTLSELVNLSLHHLGMLHQSFWARFGWMNVMFSDVWYYPLQGIGIIAVVGLLLLGIRQLRKVGGLEHWQTQILLVYLISILMVMSITVGQAILHSMTGTQGRYLFPVIIPIATLFMLGLREVLPRPYRAIGLGAVISGLFIFDFASIVFLIIPFYYA
jgi:4-amino-4-deoxy-L-arabinose transferase-like glycosyltransferase